MNNLSQAYTELNTLSHRIENFLRISNYYNYNDLSNFDIDHLDAQQLFLKAEMQTIMDRLAEAQERILYLASPVQEISRLHKNASGRYETVQGHYFCSGSPVETLVTDDDTGVTCWVRTSVEHNGKDYFLVGYDSVELDGLTVRIRKGA